MHVIHRLVTQNPIDNLDVRKLPLDRLLTGRLQNQPTVLHIEPHKRLDKHPDILARIHYVSDRVECIRDDTGRHTLRHRLNPVVQHLEVTLRKLALKDKRRKV